MRLIMTKKMASRYSPDILAMALMWNLASPALYRQMRKENVLSLPSQSHLKRLARSMDFSTGMDSCTFK
jgi:hypothetical protein